MSHSTSPAGTSLPLQSPLPRLQWERFLPGAVVLTLCMGVVALVCDFRDVPQPRVFNMHLLFGVAVSGVLAVCLVGKRLAHGSAGLNLAPGAALEFHSYTRRVTRWTYILLYVLALVQLGLHLLELRLAHGSAARIHSIDAFQIYIVYCIAPLWLLRALVLHWPMGSAPLPEPVTKEERLPERQPLPGVVPSSYFTL